MYLNSQPGWNAFSIIGKQRNATLFDSFLHRRDAGIFQPGAIVCIHRPRVVTGWLGGQGGQPLLEVLNSFQLVASGMMPASVLYCCQIK
jgi:hypothetical protein